MPSYAYTYIHLLHVRDYLYYIYNMHSLIYINCNAHTVHSKYTPNGVTALQYKAKKLHEVAKIHLATAQSLRRMDAPGIKKCALLNSWYIQLMKPGTFTNVKAAYDALAGSLHCSERHARRIAQSFEDNLLVVRSKRGQHAKRLNIINNEGVHEWMNIFMRSAIKTKGLLTTSSIKDALNADIGTIFPGQPGLSVGVNTVLGLLAATGWKWSKKTKQIYVDGHERADVVEYRKSYLARWKNEYWDRLPPLWLNSDQPRPDAVLDTDDQPVRDLRVFFHDESVAFSSEVSA